MGGSELWESALEQYCLDMYNEMQRTSLSKDDRDGLEQLQGTLDIFNTLKRSFNSHQEQFGVDGRNDRQEEITWDHPKARVIVSRNAIKQLYDNVMSHPLEETRRALDRFAFLTRQEERQRVVLVTGGTSQNPGLEQDIRTMCEDRQLPIKFTRHFSKKNM